MVQRRKYNSLRNVFFASLVFCFFVFACQPMTRQDRASVGPDVTPAASDQPSTSANPQVESTPANNGAGVIGSDWESAQKAQCEAGKFASCSALAYQAKRANQVSLALQYFTRACLTDESQSQCSPTLAQGKGVARSCFELVGLYQAQGKRDDAQKFKTCACDRGYKPACL